MEKRDKRYYTRYRTKLEGKVALEKGFAFPVEVLDISAEGAKLRTDSQIPLFQGDIIDIVIKWKSSIKAKGEIRWVKEDRPYIEFGIIFIEMDMANREALSSLISEFALSALSDLYTR